MRPIAKGKYQEWVTKEGLTKLSGWARNGLTDEQLAHNMGIAAGTLYEWKKKYPEINESLKKSKEVVDLEVENSLLNRALGMVTKSITYKMVRLDGDVLKAKRQRFLNAYKLEHPDLTAKELKMIAIESVPTYEEIPMIVQKNALAPDVSAQIFWLKNRRPDLWRDKRETELSGGVGVKQTNPFAGLTTDELKKLAENE